MNDSVQLQRNLRFPPVVASHLKSICLVTGVVLFLSIVAGLRWLYQIRTPTYVSFPARTSNGTQVHWVRSEIVLYPLLPRYKIDSTDFLEALRFGVAAWNRALRGCRAPHLQLGRPVDNLRKVRQDAKSMVIVREGLWCGDDDVRLEHCYDPTIEGITSVYPERNSGQPEDGAVREADIEINAVNYEWSLDGQRANTRNLRALITHELGHVLGLDHACNTTEAIVNRQIQNPTAPVCDSTNTSGSVMYPNVTHDPGHPLPLPGRSEADLLCETYAGLNSRVKSDALVVPDLSARRESFAFSNAF